MMMWLLVAVLSIAAAQESTKQEPPPVPSALAEKDRADLLALAMKYQGLTLQRQALAKQLQDVEKQLKDVAGELIPQITKHEQERYTLNMAACFDPDQFNQCLGWKLKPPPPPKKEGTGAIPQPPVVKK